MELDLLCSNGLIIKRHCYDFNNNNNNNNNDSISLWFAAQPGPYFHVSAPRPQRVNNFSLGLPHDFTSFMLLVHMCICNCNFIIIINNNNNNNK